MDRAFYPQIVDLVCFDLGWRRRNAIISLFECWLFIFMHAWTCLDEEEKKIIKLGKSRGNYSVLYLKFNKELNKSVEKNSAWSCRFTSAAHLLPFQRITGILILEIMKGLQNFPRRLKVPWHHARLQFNVQLKGTLCKRYSYRPENMARFGTQKEASRTKSIKFPFPFPFIFLGIVFYQIVALQVGQAETLWPRDTYGEYKSYGVVNTWVIWFQFRVMDARGKFLSTEKTSESVSPSGVKLLEC